MISSTEWERWFAWHPVCDGDGFWHWLGYVERRLVTESVTLSAFSRPSVSSWWQYRAYWAVDHQDKR